MKNDELDRILVEQEGIQPSSGFAASVMEAVREEAAAPPPIPFPWKRALPVLVFAGLMLAGLADAVVAAIVQASRGTVASPITSFSLWSSLWALVPNQLRTGMGRDVGSEIGWSAAALLTAWVSVKLSTRLFAGSA